MRCGAHVLVLLLCGLSRANSSKSSKTNLQSTYLTLAKIKMLQKDAAGAAKFEKLAHTAQAPDTTVRLNLQHTGDDDDDLLDVPKGLGGWELLKVGAINVFALGCIFLTAVLAGWELYETCWPARSFVPHHETGDYDEDFDIITYSPRSPLRNLVNFFS
jgi:hypothetical protein